MRNFGFLKLGVEIRKIGCILNLYDEREELNMPEIKATEVESAATIRVVGVGGAGGSAVNRMKDVGLSGVEFVAVNTDAQALHHSSADVKVHIGKGLGAGGDPEKGRAAAEESRDAIAKALDGSDMIFLTLGAGGGTGSGAGPVMAEEARSKDILTVGVVTKPFTFEGAKRRVNADEAIERLSKQVIPPRSFRRPSRIWRCPSAPAK